MEDKLISILNEIIATKTSEGKRIIGEIDVNISLRDDLGFTSLDLATLTVNIEDEFGVDIFEDGIVSTIGELLEKLK